METVILGGLGGGGDVGLAVILSHALRNNARVVFASFAGCSPEKYLGERVAGSLFIPRKYHPRDFEWALKTLNPTLPVYRICIKTSGQEVLEGLEWLAREYSPACTLHCDIGGDGLLTGFEEKLGSYVIDTAARAILAEASRIHGWRSILAVGGLQLEGGRQRILSLHDLAADLLYYEKHNALPSIVEPPVEAAAKAKSLLGIRRGMVSVMLPLYIAALEKRRTVNIEKGYSTGIHSIDWWTRYVFLLDNTETCNLSPLCRIARDTWLSGLKKLSRLSPPREYVWMRKKTQKNPEKMLKGVIERHIVSLDESFRATCLF